MKKKVITAMVCYSTYFVAMACTGISITTGDGTMLQSRTIEGAQMELPSYYVVIPRNQELQSFTPTAKNGMKFRAKYGAVGLSVVRPEFIAEGLNEVGLSSGLFFFPGYGAYSDYDPAKASVTIGDLHLNQWILTQCASVAEVIEIISSIKVVGLDKTAVVHYRIADTTGREVVLEFVNGEAHFYENTVGVLTNSPGFLWHLTNLNNYVNLKSGDAAEQHLKNTLLKPFGGNSGMLGLPGDFTPPSRFIRAAFFRNTAPKVTTAKEGIMQCFHLLNNFDIPIGVEHEFGQAPKMPSATQWTVVSDLTHRKIYYHTMYNNHIREIDLNTIDFKTVRYQSQELDMIKEQPIEKIIIP